MNTEKLKKYLKIINEFVLRFGFVFEFIFSIIMAIAVYKVIMYKTYYEHFSYKNMILIVVSVIIILYIAILNIVKNKKKYEKIFLHLMIPIGSLFLILMIPGFVADEPAHIYRAYDISRGILIQPIDENGKSSSSIPKDFNLNHRDTFSNYKTLNDKFKEQTDYNETEELYNPAQGYNPIMYLFSSIAFLIGRVCGMNSFLVIYMARIFNFILFLFLGYYAIKIIPLGKFLLLVYFFNPMMISQATSVSADSIINSIVIFFIAFVLHLYFQEKEMTKVQKIIFVINAIAVSLAKYVYFPVIFISLILLKSKAIGEKKNRKLIYITIAVTLLLAVASYWIGSQYENLGAYAKEHYVNSTEQIKNIITNPIRYIGTIFTTLAEFGEYYFYGFAGKYLGWINILVNSVPIIIYGFLLLMTPMIEKNNKALKRKDKIICNVVFLVVFILVLTGMYLINSEVESNIIEGVQGRYFIPIILLPLITFIMKNKYMNYSERNVLILYILFIFFIDGSALNAMCKFFTV